MEKGGASAAALATTTATPEWVNLADAARITRRQAQTIKDWIKAGAFSAEEIHRLDIPQGPGKRVEIRVTALHRVHEQRGGVAWFPELAASAQVPATIARALARLSVENQQLRDQVARLSARSTFPPRKTAPSPAPAHPLENLEPRLPVRRAVGPALNTAEAAGETVHWGRVRAATSAQGLPDGWISFSGWCQRHNINARSAERHIARGVMPAPHMPEDGQPWILRNYPILRAYDRDQHWQACQHAAEAWPERFVASCGARCPYASDEGRVVVAEVSAMAAALMPANDAADDDDGQE